MTDFSKLSLEGFLDALASDAPTPGGGTGAAVAAAMGASLAEMALMSLSGRDEPPTVARPTLQGLSAAANEILALIPESGERQVSARVYEPLKTMAAVA